MLLDKTAISRTKHHRTMYHPDENNPTEHHGLMLMLAVETVWRTDSRFKWANMSKPASRSRLY